MREISPSRQEGDAHGDVEVVFRGGNSGLLTVNTWRAYVIAVVRVLRRSRALKPSLALTLPWLVGELGFSNKSHFDPS
ncbi:unnamed protein product [Merluccius merluccius]